MNTYAPDRPAKSDEFCKNEIGQLPAIVFSSASLPKT